MTSIVKVQNLAALLFGFHGRGSNIFHVEGSNFFQRVCVCVCVCVWGGGGGGVQLLIPKETYRTCDFPGGGWGPDPLSPFWICACALFLASVLRWINFLCTILALLLASVVKWINFLRTILFNFILYAFLS